MNTSDIEELTRTIAERHGFRARDYSLRWDGGHFDRSRDVHELTVATGDGRHATAHISHLVVSDGDPWKYLRDVEAAFKPLGAASAGTRGLFVANKKNAFPRSDSKADFVNDIKIEIRDICDDKGFCRE